MLLDNYENSIRKSTHIALPAGTHKHFKALTASMNLSMQEVFEEFATRCVEEESNVTKLLEEMKQAKQRGESLRRLVKGESNEFYEIFEAEDL
jgi:hypothetical protein